MSKLNSHRFIHTKPNVPRPANTVKWVLNCLLSKLVLNMPPLVLKFSHLFEIQNSWNINTHIWIPSLLPCCWFFYVLLRLSFCFHSGSWSSSHQCLCTGRSEACGGRCLWTHQDVACQTPQSHASHVHHDTSKAALAKLAAKGTIYSGKFHGVYMCLLCLPQK